MSINNDLYESGMRFVKFVRKNLGNKVFPYSFEEDPTDHTIYVNNDHFDRLVLSINDKDLIAFHDKDHGMMEVWHLEKARYDENDPFEGERVFTAFIYDFLDRLDDEKEKN